MDAEDAIIPMGASATSINESPSLSALLFGFKLNDLNYKIWSKMMKVHPEGLYKMSYLNGKTQIVDETELGFMKWHIEDAIV